MMFPFRSSAIFRNRWVALLWAVGICLMASEIVDGLSRVTDPPSPATTVTRSDVAPQDAPPPRSPVTQTERIVR